MRGTNLDPAVALYRHEKRRVARRAIPGWKEAVRAYRALEADEAKRRRGGRPRGIRVGKART